MIRIFSAALVALVLSFSPASAHQASDSYIKLNQTAEGFAGDWKISFRDLNYVLALDQNGDGDLTWGEFKARAADVEAFLRSGLQVSKGETACALATQAPLVDQVQGEGFAVFPMTIACPESEEAPKLAYSLFFETDPSHRAIVKIASEEGNQVKVLSPQTPELDVGAHEAPVSFGDFFHSGLDHIIEGVDHIMFLLVLVLAALRQHTRPGEEKRMTAIFWEVVKILTAFTVSHATTLSLAQFGVIDVPSRLVESLIAFSIMLAAIDNFRSFLGKRVWLVAFGFGLIHGLGFASALGPLELRGIELATALLAFNIGIEAGQVALATLALTAFAIFCRTQAIRKGVIYAGSFVALTISCAWLVDRVGDIGFMPF